MKDVSDGIIGFTGDAENKTLPVLPCLDNVCLEEKPVGSTSHYEECDTSRALPEVSNTWGDFEGFDEFTPQSEQFYYADEALQLNSFTTFTSNGDCCTEQTEVQDEWDAFNEEDGVSTCKNKSAPVLQTTLLKAMGISMFNQGGGPCTKKKKGLLVTIYYQSPPPT